MKKILSLCMALLLLLASTAWASAIVDGTYAGTAMGNNGELTANVTFEGGKITAIEAIHEETPGIGDVAAQKLSELMIANQSVAVDTVSGATNTSFALINAVGEAIRAAGGSLDDFMGDVKAEELTPAEDIACDVVVVGAGGAGMTAALQAIKDGVQSVVIVEKMPIAGGNTVRSTGGMNAAATEAQQGNEFAESAGIEKTIATAKETYGDVHADLISTVEAQWAAYQADPKGYFDTPELFVLDTLIGGYNINDPVLVAMMANQSASAVTWLKGIGADLSNVGFAGGASVKRSHRPVDADGKILPVGSYLVPVLTKNCQETEGITMILGTRATEIVMQDGVAVGVKVEGPSGAYTISAKAVVMATGGFGANEAMYTQYRPELKGFVTTNMAGATGDGIVMGLAVGADTVDLEQIQIHPTVEQATSSMITESIRGDGAILFNQEGVRFYDEVSTRDKVSAAVIAQTGSYAYLIVDQKMVDESGVIAGYINSGLTIKGDTIEALAEAIDVDPATLSQTMSDWNEAVKAGKDELFGRTSITEPLETAPYYVVKIAPGVHHTMGGLKIDPECHVIATSGEAIPGLFAAGEVAGGVHGGNRLGGNAVVDIFVFGRIAGSSAAAFAGK